MSTKPYNQIKGLSVQEKEHFEEEICDMAEHYKELDLEESRVEKSRGIFNCLVKGSISNRPFLVKTEAINFLAMVSDIKNKILEEINPIDESRRSAKNAFGGIPRPMLDRQN